MKEKPFPIEFLLLFIGGFELLVNWQQAAILNFISFFALVFLYLWFDQQLRGRISPQKKVKYERDQKIIFFLLIGLVLSLTMVESIFDRSRNTELSIHDGAMQMEAALNFLWRGKNPYAADYRATEFAKAADDIYTTQGVVIPNPAINYLIYLPANLLIGAPFYFLFRAITGFYDQRIIGLLSFVITLFIIDNLLTEEKMKRILTAALLFNPLFLWFFLDGRDDIVVLTWLLLTVLFLKKEKILASAAALGLACATKQTAWLFVPFYYAYLYFKGKDWRLVIKKTWLFPVVFLLIILPFLIWNPKAFYEAIIAYPLGITKNSYPINGFGAAVLLYKMGFARSVTDSLPIWKLQVPIVLFTGYLLLKRQKEQNSLANLVYHYAIFLFVFWFFSRFFHDNYVGFVSQLFLISYFL